MATLVAGEVNVDDVDDYGSIYDEELVVPLATMDCHHGTNTNHLSRSPSWKTKKLMCAGLIGLTAAVASSALLFFSILDFSNQASTGSTFLLRDSDCVVGLGIENIHNTPWPGNNDFKADDHPASADDNIKDDDGNPTNTYFFTCFSFQGGEDHCWSMSYKDWAGNWQDSNYCYYLV